MATDAAERGQRGLKRILDKLENSIEAGSYYEAHQMYRTLYFRYTSQKKYECCLQLLWNGAQQLIQKGQESCGVDLAMLIIETLERSEPTNDVGEEWMVRLGKFIKQVSSSIVERETLINCAIKWSGSISGKSQGHPNMHKYIGHVFLTEDNMEQARNHYLLCKDGNIFGHFLIKLHQTKGYRNEVDLFIVQAVLQQLCLKDHETARITFVNYTTYHPQIRRKSAPFRQPLLNFLHFLFLCIEIGQFDKFCKLCDLYKLSLNRDTDFGKALKRIGLIYFGAPQPNPMLIGGGGFMGGVFGDMFSRLFQGLDEDNTDTDSEEQHNRPTAVSSELD